MSTRSTLRVTVVGLLLATPLGTGCGGGGDGAASTPTAAGPPATDAAPAAPVGNDADSPSVASDESTDDAIAATQQQVDQILVHFPDEPAAMAAVLLSRDQGYDVDQIIGAGTSGRLRPDGRITDAEGGVMQPAGPATGLLIDDRDEVAQRSGFRSRAAEAPSWPMKISETIRKIDANTEGMGGLLVVLSAMKSGYSVEQFVMHFWLDGQIGLVRSADIDGVLALYDESGSIITPFSRTDAATTTTTDAPAATSEPPDDAARLEQLVADAVGVYELANNPAAEFLSHPQVVSSVGPDGTFVIEPDGTVSGDYGYSYTWDAGSAGTTSETFDCAIASAPLQLLDDGLTFEASWTCVDVAVATTVTGYVDAELGQIVMNGAGGDLYYER